jgi:uncharacterized protein (DUF885 family)
MIGDTRFDHLLPDLSAEARAEADRLHRAALRAVGPADAALDDASRLDAAVVRTIASRELSALELGFYQLVAGSHMGDPWTPCPGTLLSQLSTLQRASTADALGRYLTRLRAIPRFLDQAGSALREGSRDGRSQPEPVLRRTLGQVQRILETPPDDSPALRPVPPTATDERSQVAKVLRTAVLPAYERFGLEIRALIAGARNDLGLSGLRGGDELYAGYVTYWTALDLAPDLLHQQGLRDLDQLRSERYQSAALLGFDSPEAATQAYLSEGRNPRTRRDLLRRAQEQVRRSWEVSKSYFRRLPRRNCDVELVERSREADYLGYYQPAPADGTRPALYFVSGAGLRSRPMHRLAPLSYHEANPGHHFQIALEQEAKDRSPLRRFTNDYASAAFVEGWGLYAERLADEMGLYRDEFERLGMLDEQSFRCARLVVDTGIHAFGWTREQAIETLAENGVPLYEAAIEVDRYAAMPGQGLTYRLGQLALEDCRRRLVERDPASFDLAEFHDRVLMLGSLPLPTLQQELVGSALPLP